MCRGLGRDPRRRYLQSIHLFPLLMRSDRVDSAPSRVPAEVPTRHPRRDRFFTVVFIVVLVVMGSLAFRPRASAMLDAENRTMAPWPAGALTPAADSWLLRH